VWTALIGHFLQQVIGEKAMASAESAVNVWIMRHTILVWFGIFLNTLFIVPLLFFPQWMLDLFHIPLNELIWARASGGLLMIISVFYVPAAIDFDRYRANAYIAVFLSRTFGATFFFFAVVLFGQPLGFLSISFVDALIGLTTLYCLIRIKTLEAQHRASIVADDQRPGQKPEPFDHSPKVRSIGPTSGW
jgi:hypothetical protein